MTETNEGMIRHLRLKTDAGVIDAPVKLAVGEGGKILATTCTGNRLLPTPLRRNGRLVYALPGGGEVLGD